MEKQSFKGTEDRKEWRITYGKPYELDKYDKLILKALGENARQSLADLSKKVGLSRDAIRNRIKKMIKRKIIWSFRVDINPALVGFPVMNYVFITLYNPSLEIEEKFIKYMKNNPNIAYCASLVGKWDYMILIYARNPSEFDSVMKKIRQKFPDLIKDYESHGLIDELKWDETSVLD